MGSRKSRMLLKLLTVERPALVPVDRIIGVLWAGKPPAAAEQNVATLVSRLRGALGPDIILGGRPGYRLADEPGVSVDLDIAARYCAQAERKLASAASAALVAAEQAIMLLSAGPAVAEEPYAAWADVARDEQREMLRRARLVAAEAALAVGDACSAVRFTGPAMAADPLDEAACRWYMSALAAAGEPARALAAYAALRSRLGEELGADPAPQTQDIHLAILREQPADLPDSVSSSLGLAGPGSLTPALIGAPQGPAGRPGRRSGGPVRCLEPRPHRGSRPHHDHRRGRDREDSAR